VGSATITSNLGQGQYVVSLTKSQAAITAQKTSLTTRKTEIEAAIAAKEIELADLNVIQTEKYEALKTAVGAYAVADPPTKALRKAVTDAQAAYITAQANVNKKQTEINLLGLELVSVNKRLEQIETALAVESKTVWCVDYSTELTGSVGTIEINGEADAINIMPGGAAGAGLLQHPLAMTPSGVFVNSAKLPAWQKWMPTYRVGTITALDTDNDTADVTLDDAKSSAQDIAINQALSLSAVPVDYMTSDADTFVVGDRVVVKFEGQKQESPRVIGFNSNPRECGVYLPIKINILIDSYSPHEDFAVRVDTVLSGNVYVLMPSKIYQSGEVINLYVPRSIYETLLQQGTGVYLHCGQLQYLALGIDKLAGEYNYRYYRITVSFPEQSCSIPIAVDVAWTEDEAKEYAEGAIGLTGDHSPCPAIDEGRQWFITDSWYEAQEGGGYVVFATYTAPASTAYQYIEASVVKIG